ncbi:hypothetical protein M405DRAFT_847737 [Rhizopogon salebrosus TDB-379]|nr:hypothetical protein M405DRAFT_847737 [Rhizopogon salebrosus TDB-379]
MRCRGKEKQKAAGWLEPAGEWAEHSAVQRQESHVPHYHATKSIFYPITRTSFWVRMPIIYGQVELTSIDQIVGDFRPIATGHEKPELEYRTCMNRYLFLPGSPRTCTVQLRTRSESQNGNER